MNTLWVSGSCRAYSTHVNSNLDLSLNDYENNLVKLVYDLYDMPKPQHITYDQIASWLVFVDGGKNNLKFPISGTQSYIIKRSYCTSTNPIGPNKGLTGKTTNNSTLNPVFFSGLSEINFSFYVVILEDRKLKLGKRVILNFIIKVHPKDRLQLESIKDFLNTGFIKLNNKSIVLIIKALDPIINIIIPYFDKYPLELKKADFLWWKEVAIIIQNKEHLTPQGLAKILKLRSSETRIVIWGTNLSSSVGLPKFSENVSHIV